MMLYCAILPLPSAMIIQNGNFPKYYYLVSVSLLFGGLVALGWTIYKLVKTFGDALVCRVPLRATSEIDIARGGKLNLCLQISKFAFFPARNLEFRLFKQADGREIDLRKASPFSMSQRKALMTITFPVRNFEAAAGKYTLQVSGFDPQIDYAEYSIVIEQPIGLKVFFYILGIIITGGMFIAGFVFTLIFLSAHK